MDDDKRPQVGGCPRCGQSFRADRPAGSRATEDRAVNICGPCGSDEATGRGVIPMSEWPVGPATT